MPNIYGVLAGAGFLLAAASACHENEQPMAPANGNIYDSPGSRPPRPDAAPATGGTSSSTGLGPVAEDAGTTMGGMGGMGAMPPTGGAFNASGDLAPKKGDNRGMPAGPE